MEFNFERRAAIAELLAQADPPELPRRGHRVRVDGKPERYALLPQLSALYVQRKLLALEERRESIVARGERRNVQWGNCPALRREVPVLA